jgi:hypothetical protein
MFDPHEPASRRDLLKLAAAGVMAGSASGWFGLLADRAARAAAQGARHKSCILLWMAGGPSQAHTFDVKGGGDYKPINTSVPGIQISEHLPKLARQAQHLAILRGMSTGDGNHQTATYLMHTGFRRGTGGVVHPTLGSMVAHDLGRPDADLPNFVALGGTLGPGYLGPRYAPLIVNDFNRGLPDLRPAPGNADVNDRAGLVEELDRAFMNDYQSPAITAHTTYLKRAVRLMHSKTTKAFELGEEPARSREAYGNSRFGQGCLLARRLVEAGVPFVEVSLGGWDTHANAAQRVRTLSSQFDPAMAALITDLRDRRLLDSTLVIWMGEFGRDPRRGSNHYARAWSTVLAGAGIRAGQVVGSTGANGAEVRDTKISSPDFLATVCKALGIDHTRNYVARGGRPMPKVNKGARPVAQLFA